MSNKSNDDAYVKKSNLYQTIFEVSPDYIYLTDPEGDANLALLARIGVSREEVRRMRPLDFFAGSNLDEIMNAVSALKRGETVQGLKVKAKSASGETFEYEVNAVPILDHGKMVGVLNLARDITESERTSEKYSMIMKDILLGIDDTTFESQQIAAKTAHKINNPLMAILNYAQILKDELNGIVDISQKPFTFIDNILRETNRIKEIVTKMKARPRGETQ